MALCVPVISPTSSTSSSSRPSAASPQTSPASSPASSSSSPSSAFETMTLPVLKQVRSTTSSSPYSLRGSRSGSRSAHDLHHSENGSTTTLHRNYVDSSDTPRASQFTPRSPSPSQRLSSLSINDPTTNTQDFRTSTLSTFTTISQYQTCHPHFWFSDGSIVLSVQSTLFKVHMSTLTTHSEMFADMFDMTQHMDQGAHSQGGGHDQDEWCDGCRVVKLFDDASDDWVDLLGAIYKPNHFDDVPSRQYQIRHSSPSTSPLNDSSTSPPKPFNLSVALDFTAGILRLSHKYLIPHLRSRCLALLAPFFPTTFEDFVISMPLLNPHFSQYPSPPPATPAPSPPPPPSSSSLSSSSTTTTTTTHRKRNRDSGPLMTRTSTIIRAIHLFHTIDASQFLPYAYYCLTKLPSKRIMNMSALDASAKSSALDASVRLSPRDASARLSPRDAFPEQRPGLSWREKALIVYGKEQLRRAAREDVMGCLGAFRRAVGCTGGGGDRDRERDGDGDDGGDDGDDGGDDGGYGGYGGYGTDSMYGGVYGHHGALRECDYAARAAWERILCGDLGGAEDGAGIVSGGGGGMNGLVNPNPNVNANANTNTGWVSTASLITLSIGASSYAPPPAIAATTSSGSTASSNSTSTSTSTNPSSTSTSTNPSSTSTSTNPSSTSTSTNTSSQSLNFPTSPPEPTSLTDPFAPFLSWDMISTHTSSSYPSSRYSSSYAAPYRSYTSLGQSSYSYPYQSHPHQPSYSSPYSSPYSSSYTQPYSSPYTHHHQSHQPVPTHPPPRPPTMCPACLNECQIRHFEARRRVWEVLPGVFGLGGWGVGGEDD